MLRGAQVFVDVPTRHCHFCGLPIPNDEAATQPKNKAYWAHFECWYDGSVHPRDPETGRRL